MHPPHLDLSSGMWRPFMHPCAARATLLQAASFVSVSLNILSQVTDKSTFVGIQQTLTIKSLPSGEYSITRRRRHYVTALTTSTLKALSDHEIIVKHHTFLVFFYPFHGWGRQWSTSAMSTWDLRSTSGRQWERNVIKMVQYSGIGRGNWGGLKPPLPTYRKGTRN